MASLVLGAVGTAIGGAVGGSILGLSGAVIGGMIGSAVGSVVDSLLLASLAPNQRMEGARLDSMRITASTEGVVVPRIHGRARIGGNVIWATDFREVIKKKKHSGGGKGGGGGSVTTKEYLYYASFAVALCEGPITGIGRIWADSKPMKLDGVTWRLYRGDEDQLPDPFISAKMGAANTPAYRGTAYVVFEDLALERYGNRLPQLTFEVFRPLADSDTAEGQVRAVTMIPASGEFAYATTPIKKTVSGSTVAENVNALPGEADFVVALDRLQALAPEVESVSLVVAWFGSDLRAGACTIRPGVEVSAKSTEPKTWSVNGVGRSSAWLVSTVDGNPAYGGTPADFSVVEAIQEIKARGLRVTFYPFVLMDIPAGNSLPNPYSNNAAGVGQAVYPWRGRITCSPAAGFTGTVDKTGTAATQIGDFFGDAAPGDFNVSGTSVTWDGASGEWGFRRMVLHYAHLCDAAGGVDAFLIGSELRGITQTRSGAASYPGVTELADLAGDCRSILGSSTKISYAADWTEYSDHRPDDGTGDVFFNMDPLWSDADIDFVGIDNYMPLSDWRDGFEHLDAQVAPAIYDQDYLQANIEGGEGYDWYYASDADRAVQTRTAITDGGAGKPWVFRYKDIRNWWLNEHFNRPGGVESGTATAWVPEGKQVWFTEFGCPAVDRGPNQPNVFHDPKSAESFVPWFSRGWRDDAVQRAYLEATLDYWNRDSNNPISSVYSLRMISRPEMAAWTWDARPYPFFPELVDVWSDSENWRLGHWLTGRLGAVSLRALVRHLCLQAGLEAERIDVTGLWGAVEGLVISAIESPRTSIAVLARHFGFDAVESQGVIRFVMRGQTPRAVLTVDDLVLGTDEGEPFEMIRGQETELPQALKWAVARADGDYETASVEARRITVAASRVTTESFPVVVPAEEAERRCRRVLQEIWVGRERMTMQLPPSRLALDPTDVITLDHDGRDIEMRLVNVAEREARTLEAIVQDRSVYDMPAGQPAPHRRSRTVVFGRPLVEILDIPQILDEEAAHQPLMATFAVPWPGDLAVYRSTTDDDFELLTTLSAPAQIGSLVEPLPEGPTSRWDLGNEVVIDLLSGTLESVTDRALFGGANVFAVETAPDVWEVFQAGLVELVSTGRYRLRRLLRGQRGTEWAMVPEIAAGARVVVLDAAVERLPVEQAELGLAWNWRVGPATLDFTEDSFEALSYTPRGVGLRPFSVCHVFADAESLPGKITFGWKRRSRSPAADSWGAVDVPLSEDIEQYEVDILDGYTLLRTMVTLAPSVGYTQAQQTADWGAPLALGDTLTIRIAQISAVVGRGAAREYTLTL